MANAMSELIWIRSLLASLWVFLDKPIKLYYDNQAALHIAKNPIFHERTKHIKINCHFVHERLISGDLQVNYASSKHK